jgi:hypothetical protein
VRRRVQAPHVVYAAGSTRPRILSAGDRRCVPRQLPENGFGPMYSKTCWRFTNRNLSCRFAVRCWEQSWERSDLLSAAGAAPPARIRKDRRFIGYVGIQRHVSGQLHSDDFPNTLISTSVDWFEMQSSSEVPCVIHWPGAARTICEIPCHSEAAFLESLAAAGCTGFLKRQSR